MLLFRDDPVRIRLIMGGGELQLVEWLRSQQRNDPRVALGVGDDMAVVAVSSSTILLTCDMLLDGVHFDTSRHSLSQIGRKAVACSLSDCAAMAVCPLAATLSVALPTDLPMDDAKELFRGMLTVAAEYDTAIVGGDTTRWSHPLAIDVSVTATTFEGINPVTRAGAKPGDMLYVTDKLGGSLRGHHLTFIPRVNEAREIARALGGRLHAMMDISDGLSLDLWRMCHASGVGATLDETQLQDVISDGAEWCASQDGRSPLEHVLSDGEDFELLLAIAAGETPAGDVALYPVGAITDRDLLLRRANGQLERLEPRGFVH